MPLLRAVDARPRQDDHSCWPFETGSSNQGVRSGIPRKPMKSHARKREEGHIPRPRNAFIIFRTDFVVNGRIPSTIETHSQNLSRIAGTVWKSMSAEEKKPWFARAEEEKAKHMERHPEYHYHPTDPYMLRNRRKVTKGRGEVELRRANRWCDELATILKQGVKGEELEKEVEKRTRTRAPMVVDEFPRVEPVMDEGLYSDRSTIVSPLDKVPIDVPGIASLLSGPLPFSTSSRESTPTTLSSTTSSPSSNADTLPLPSLSLTFPSIIPSKVTGYATNPPPPFPGALHVPDKPRFGASSFKNFLTSKGRSYDTPSSFQFPSSFSRSSSFMTTHNPSEGGKGERWALRGPSQPRTDVATRHLCSADSEDGDSACDYESE